VLLGGLPSPRKKRQVALGVILEAAERAGASLCRYHQAVLAAKRSGNSRDRPSRYDGAMEVHAAPEGDAGLALVATSWNSTAESARAQGSLLAPGRTRERATSCSAVGERYDPAMDPATR